MVSGQRIRETVLYYAPEKKEYETKLKGVLVRMGIRIRIVAREQVHETVGSLLGFAGWNAADQRSTGKEKGPDGRPSGAGDSGRGNGNMAGGLAAVQGGIAEEVLVMHNFSSRRMDELLLNFRKAGVPRIALKAVVTETNCQWTFYHLYEEIRDEHGKMTKQ